jgi:hypothetical protein
VWWVPQVFPLHCELSWPIWSYEGAIDVLTAGWCYCCCRGCYSSKGRSFTLPYLCLRSCTVACAEEALHCLVLVFGALLAVQVAKVWRSRRVTWPPSLLACLARESHGQLVINNLSVASTYRVKQRHTARGWHCWHVMYANLIRPQDIRKAALEAPACCAGFSRGVCDSIVVATYGLYFSELACEAACSNVLCCAMLCCAVGTSRRQSTSTTVSTRL